MSAGYHHMGANARIRDGVRAGNGHALNYSASHVTAFAGEPLKAGDPVLLLKPVNGDTSLPTAIKPDIAPTELPDPRQMGYTGNTCTYCGSTRMTVSGHCEKCEDCGESSGCS